MVAVAATAVVSRVRVVTTAATAHSGSDGGKLIISGAPPSRVAIAYMSDGAPLRGRDGCRRRRATGAAATAVLRSVSSGYGGAVMRGATDGGGGDATHAAGP